MLVPINILAKGPSYSIWNKYCWCCYNKERMILLYFMFLAYMWTERMVIHKCRKEITKKNKISIRFFILHHHSNRKKTRPFERGSMWCDVCVHRLYIINNHWSTSRYFFFSFDIQWFSFLNEFSFSFPNFRTCTFDKNNEIKKTVINFDNKNQPRMKWMVKRKRRTQKMHN